jgi:hypothetical protein
MIIDGFVENMMLLWTIGFVHTSTRRLQLLQSGFGCGVQAYPISLSLLSQTSEGYYTKFCSIILSVCKLLSSGRLHNVWCSMSCTLLREVVGKSVVQSNDFVNNFSAFGSLFFGFILEIEEPACFKVFAFLTIFENHTQPLVVIAF